MTLWHSADATDAWRPSPSGRPGGQKRFSDVTIETALVLRLVFSLPLRQTEGFVRSVLALMGADLDAPDHTTRTRGVETAWFLHCAGLVDESTEALKCRPKL